LRLQLDLHISFQKPLGKWRLKKLDLYQLMNQNSHHLCQYSIAVKNDIELQNYRIFINGLSISSHNFPEVFQLERRTEIIKFNQ